MPSKKPVMAVTGLSLFGHFKTVYVDTTEESLGAEKMLEILENEFLPLMNRFPSPRSVITLDGSQAHPRQRIKTLCDRFGVKVLYVPHYSPDYHPIELLFNAARSVMKRNYAYNMDAAHDIVHYFSLSLDKAFTPEQACNAFVHCGIPVSPAERAWALA